MPTDLTGTPTALGIGTFNVDVDAPSGLGFNAAMGQIDALLAAQDAEITAQDATIAARATIDSPAFTGTPTAPTPLTSDNTTKIATTAFVVAKIGSAPSAADKTSASDQLFTGGGAIGYGTGSGGTVTQGTSKTTAVTINSPSGVINLVGGSMTLNQTVAFTVNNSHVAASDTIAVSWASSDGALGAIPLWVTSVAAGSFAIVYYALQATGHNIIGPINFAVIKAAAS